MERGSSARQDLVFEDVVVGQSWRTAAHKVSDKDIADFAEVTHDRHPLHADDSFARSMGFPRRIAHGLYGLSLMEGLKSRLPCLVRGARVIAGAPFNTGILAGGVRYGHLPAQPEVVSRARGIDEACRAFGGPLGAAALQFPVGHPAVSIVLPGPRNASQARACAEWVDLAIPATFWTSLEERGFIPHQVPVAEERAA
jgi:hypothetical protein